MTAEEALPLAKSIYMTLADTLSSEEIQPLGMAISALQKQIQMKPTRLEGHEEERYCPVCGCVDVIDYDFGIKHRFCPDCGQALKWED